MLAALAAGTSPWIAALTVGSRLHEVYAALGWSVSTRQVCVPRWFAADAVPTSQSDGAMIAIISEFLVIVAVARVLDLLRREARGWLTIGAAWLLVAAIVTALVGDWDSGAVSRGIGAPPGTASLAALTSGVLSALLHAAFNWMTTDGALLILAGGMAVSRLESRRRRKGDG